jgi:hypothetical protein
MATGDATPTAVAMAVTVLCLRCHWPCHDQQGNDGRGRRAHPGSVAATPLGLYAACDLKAGLREQVPCHHEVLIRSAPIASARAASLAFLGASQPATVSVSDRHPDARPRRAGQRGNAIGHRAASRCRGIFRCDGAWGPRRRRPRFRREGSAVDSRYADRCATTPPCSYGFGCPKA